MCARAGVSRVSASGLARRGLRTARMHSQTQMMTLMLLQCGFATAAAPRRTGAPLVDTSSGVEKAPGAKDVDLIRAFCEAVRSA